MRKLVSIQRIDEVQPINGADLIEKIRIKGWWVVVKKDVQFKVGDLCVYFEIDSLLPIRPEFEFLLKGSSPKRMLFEGKEIEGIRLKTVKLRGQISQGLALPINTFPELVKNMLECPDVYNVEDDITEVLKVIKYEPPIPACLVGEIEGSFPGVMPKTDEERIQNLPKFLIEYQNKSFYITEKLDGTSCTIFRYENKFGICGREWQLRDTEGNTYWQVAKQYNLPERMIDGFALQGEICGEGLNSNKLKIKGHDIFIFYVYDILNGRFLKLDDMEKFVKELGLKTVPVLERNFILNHTIKQLLEMSNGSSVVNPASRREGLVFRLNNSENKISFKSVSDKFLLNDEE